MDNKDLQEVVDAILQAMLLMEEKINKRFDTMDDRFDKLEAKMEDVEDRLKDIQADTMIVTGKVDKQGREIDRLKRTI